MLGKSKDLFLVCVFMMISFASKAQEQREFRAAWVATVANIDWPSAKNLYPELQKQEFIQILNQLQKNKFNAVIVQIRPCADAFYASQYEPWSVYLNGQSGMPPMPYYDPLQFMIDECHKRCIEFHAWLNPYRALMNATKNPHAASHITHQKPQWFVSYGAKKYFNPGLPEVHDYFINIVKDIVNRYDVDAIHMDDYFYPYREGKLEFPDLQAYIKYNKNNLSRDDWRRENVNRLIEDLNKNIKGLKPYVKFGISPFGVWRNSYVDSLYGSKTNGGQTNYDDLFADVRLWQQKGWIDYCVPQLYWEFGHKSVDYETLLQWWNDNAFDRHMYIGHALYKLATAKYPWHNFNEIKNQIERRRDFEKVQGSVFFSMNAMIKNTAGINMMFQTAFANTALVPEMPWLQYPKPTAVKIYLNYKGNEKIIQWQSDNKYNRYYAIYRKLQNTQDKMELFELTSDTSFQLPQDNLYSYAVAALNRIYNQSELSNWVR